MTSGAQSVLVLLMNIPGLISFKIDQFSENKDVPDIHTLPCINQIAAVDHRGLSSVL